MTQSSSKLSLATDAAPGPGAGSFSPREIVSELDRYIIGQGEAKRAVAVALRNVGEDPAPLGLREVELVSREHVRARRYGRDTLEEVFLDIARGNGKGQGDVEPGDHDKGRGAAA